MLKKGKENSCCPSGPELVSLLYSELDEADGFAIGEHLRECSNCVEEFASLSEARLSAYEWNRDEFAHLETPAVAIPYGSPAHTWIERIYAGLVFANPYRTAAAAFGFFALTIAFGYLLIGSWANTPLPVSLDSDTVAKIDSPNSRMPVSAAKPDESEINTPRTAPAVYAEFRNRQKTRSAAPRVKAIPKKQLVKPDALVAKEQAAPRLAPNATDLSDTSLRLAELFSELDANE
jgi:hypothetical protein